MCEMIYLGVNCANFEILTRQKSRVSGNFGIKHLWGLSWQRVLMIWLTSKRDLLYNIFPNRVYAFPDAYLERTSREENVYNL